VEDLRMDWRFGNFRETDRALRLRAATSQAPTMTVMSRAASIRIDGFATLVGQTFKTLCNGSMKTYLSLDLTGCL